MPVCRLQRVHELATRVAHRAVGQASLLALAGILACNTGDVAAPMSATSAARPELAADAAPASLLSAATPLGLGVVPRTIGFTTYEGSGEVVHPDVVTMPSEWNGHRYWNAITPYPKSASQFENPSLFASDDGDSWAVPAGVTNPLARTTRGYLSDPDMLFEPASGRMWLYYREVENQQKRPPAKPVHVADHVWLTTSDDAVHWSTPRRVASDTGRFVVSPSVVRTADGWRMYQIDAGTGGCSSKANRVMVRQSADGIAWRAAVPAGLVQPGFVPWHLDVQYIEARGEYWALLAAYPSSRGCMASSLFLATSTDGTTWTAYPSPVLAPGELPQFSAAVYRSTLAYEKGDSVTIWYSGARVAKPGKNKKPPVFAWSAAVSHSTVAELFARVNDRSRKATLSVAPTGNVVTVSGTIAP